MKFSVLMSVYKNDSPSFLALALESIYEKQTKKPDEIVIVFDGPITNGLQAVLTTFQKGKEKIVKFYPLEVNKGLGEALRFGSEKCSGDYIFRMDADDISDPYRFELQSKFLEAHPEVDVLGSSIEEFQSDPFEKKKRRKACPLTHKDIVTMSKRRNPMNHMTVCIKKRSLLNAGGYQTLLLVEDYYLWIRMIIQGFLFANMEETLVHVRIGNGLEKRRSNKVIIESWKKLQEYMLSENFITKREASKNMVYIKMFIRLPIFIKKIAYKLFLRG